MTKIAEASCPDCEEQIKTADIIEVTKTYSCPDCGKDYIKDWDKKTITCNNPDCYTSEKVLLIDVELAEHQQEVDKFTKQMKKAKPENLKTLTESLSSLNKDFRSHLNKRREKDFDFDKVKYACHNCGEVMTREDWNNCNMTCIKCGENQTKKVTRDKTVFKPVPSKHIVACCPEYHILARYPNDRNKS